MDLNHRPLGPEPSALIQAELRPEEFQGSKFSLLKSPDVISTGVPTCRDEAEKSIYKQIPRLPLGKLGVARNDVFNITQ